MGVRIQGTIRKENQEYNGLEAVADHLEKGGRRYMAVCEVESVGYEVDFTKGGVHSPKVRLISIEPLEGDAALAARRLRDEAYSSRTGQAAPPPSLFDDDVVDADVVDDGDDPTESPDSEGTWPGDAEAADGPDTAASAG